MIPPERVEVGLVAVLVFLAPSVWRCVNLLSILDLALTSRQRSMPHLRIECQDDEVGLGIRETHQHNQDVNKPQITNWEPRM